MRLLLAAPYLIFALRPALPIALTAVALASVGYSATLLLQQRLMALTPEELSGQALGLHSSGMLAMQGVGATLAGAVAQLTSPQAAMAAMAGASVAVTLALAPGLRPPPVRPQPVDLSSADVAEAARLSGGARFLRVGSGGARFLRVGDVRHGRVEDLQELVRIRRQGETVLARPESDHAPAHALIGDHRPGRGRAERCDRAAFVSGRLPGRLGIGHGQAADAEQSP
jgi:hypothetical protein